ncbi:MAG: hypothetical protein LBF86_09575 [Helicobacteraceae bacterium]|jgi:hypothetical protein|nr:hypothetical protein [Helicobacteraceae bacterium]
MKKIFLICMLSAFICAAAESPAVVWLRKDHFACSREAWLRDTFEFAAKSDRASMASYLAMGRCFRTLEARVYIWSLKIDAAQVLIDGRKMWVAAAAVKFDD